VRARVREREVGGKRGTERESESESERERERERDIYIEGYIYI
jgi:hypothetical protein